MLQSLLLGLQQQQTQPTAGQHAPANQRVLLADDLLRSSQTLMHRNTQRMDWCPLAFQQPSPHSLCSSQKQHCPPLQSSRSLLRQHQPQESHIKPSCLQKDYKKPQVTKCGFCHTQTSSGTALAYPYQTGSFMLQEVQELDFLHHSQQHRESIKTALLKMMFFLLLLHE